MIYPTDLKSLLVYKKIELPFDKIPQFSSRDVAYQTGDQRLRPFYQYEPSLTSFKTAIDNRKTKNVNRKVLVDTLLKQYEPIANNSQAVKNIQTLKSDNTFTIITAHQPSLLTGPLYYIYKICSVISLSRTLNQAYPEYHIVPVFVVGGEDHDFEEIATARFFNKSFSWSTDQIGAVGRMSLDGLQEVLDQVTDTFGSMPHADELTSIINQSIQQSKTYGDFAFRLTHALFSDHELIIANMDQPSYKQILLPYIIQDIQDGTSQEMVQLDQEKLDQAGFKSQAHAREVNIFIQNEDRDRVIDNNDGTYSIGEHTYSQTELFDLLKNRYQDISPNVVLRPVFQEVIMPNLAYIGGGGELAYWMERPSLFKAMDIPFPILIRRDSVLIIDKKSAENLDSNHIKIDQLFEREEQIINQFALNNAAIDINLDEVKAEISAAYKKAVTLSEQIDPTLGKFVLADEAKTIKSIENIESKLLRAEKKKQETEINKIARIKQRFFPNNDSLQERHDNFIPFYLKNGKKWIDALVTELDPLNKNMKILIEQ